MYRTPISVMNRFLITVGLVLGILMPGHSQYSHFPSAQIYGGPHIRLEQGQAATRDKVFGANFYQPGGTGGQVVDNTNILTGQPSYTVPLYTLSARGGIAFPFNLTFSGPTFPTAHNHNDRAPVGWIGLGWSMATPFVAVNHRGTFTYSDDVVMCNLGPYGGGQILQNEAGQYFVATNPAIRVEVEKVTDGGSPLHGQIKEWRFIMPDGTRLVFGDASSSGVANSERFVQSSGGVIIASPYNTSTSRPFIYRWDLHRMEDDSRTTGIDFEYEKFQESLWSGKSYTRESYLKNVTWRDEFGNEISRVGLSTISMGTGEYAGYFPNEAKTSQKLFETRRLLSLEVFHEGKKHAKYVLGRTTTNTDYGPKGLLTGIERYFADEEVQGSGWAFAYRSGDFLLEEITLPSGGKEKYEYSTKNLSGTLAEQELGGSVFLNENGGVVDPSKGNPTDWSVEATCDDRFCFEIVRYKKDGGRDTVHLRGTHNTGNYFDLDPVAFHKRLHASGTDADQWQILPMGDHLIISDNNNGNVELWKWRGNSFVKINSEVGDSNDPMQSSFPGTISIIPGNNFFAVHKSSGSQRVWVYLKHPGTGEWKNLTVGNRDDASCHFKNPPQGGANPQAGSTTDCFTWSSTPAIKVLANHNMIVVHTMSSSASGTHLVYMYALARDGDTFESIGHLIPQLPDGQQYSGAPQRWNDRIIDSRLGRDELVLKTTKNISGNRHSRYDILFYDGATIKRMAALDWERDRIETHAHNHWSGTRHERNLLLGPNYFIHSSAYPNGNQRIEYWRKRQNADSVYFELTDTLRTDLPHEGQADIRIATSPRFVAIEYYPDGTFSQGMQPRYYPLTQNGQYRTWLYAIDEGGDIGAIDAAEYSHNWGGGCVTRLWDISLSPLDNVMHGRTSKGESSCACTSSCDYIPLSYKMNHLGGGFIKTISPLPQNGWGLLRHDVASLSNRNLLGIRIIQDTAGDLETIFTRRYFFNGINYSNPTTTDVVHRFVRESTPDDLYPELATEFEFVTNNGDYPVVFNHNALTAQFSLTRVSRSGIPGRVDYLQLVDHPGQKLLMDSAGLSGRVHTVDTRNSGGGMVAKEKTFFAEPYVKEGSDPWPQGVSAIRPERTEVRQWAENSSYRTGRTHYHAWSDSLEMPLFTVTELGDRAVIQQSLLDAGGYRVRQRVTYDYPLSGVPSSQDFEQAKGDVLVPDGENGKYAVGFSRVDHDGTFQYHVNRVYGWRGPGGEWTDGELKTGPIPDFSLTDEIVTLSEVSQRNSLGQVLESFVEDGDSRDYTAYFYGGRASLPIAVVTGTPRDNVAILTADNGNVPERSYLDHDGQWQMGVGYLTPNDAQSRTGRFSLMTLGADILSSVIYPKHVETEGFGYIVSAWLYGMDQSHPPALSVERRRSNGFLESDTTLSAPVSGTYQANRWQRWELLIPHGELTSGGMFQESSGDYLVIRLGSTGWMHIDNIIAIPDHAMFSLTSYNERGQPTHVTDMHHRTVTHEYGHAGQYLGSRDERGRIFNQSGFNKAGENLQ